MIMLMLILLSHRAFCMAFLGRSSVVLGLFVHATPV